MGPYEIAFFSLYFWLEAPTTTFYFLVDSLALKKIPPNIFDRNANGLGSVETHVSSLDSYSFSKTWNLLHGFKSCSKLKILNSKLVLVFMSDFATNF